MTAKFIIDVHTFLASVLPVHYETYIRSRRWKEKADAAKARAGWRCQTCNRPHKQVRLEAHHRTYERLGWEVDEDITVLCSDCHKAITRLIQEIRHSTKSFPAFRPGLRRGW